MDERHARNSVIQIRCTEITGAACHCRHDAFLPDSQQRTHYLLAVCGRLGNQLQLHWWFVLFFLQNEAVVIAHDRTFVPEKRAFRGACSSAGMVVTWHTSCVRSHDGRAGTDGTQLSVTTECCGSFDDRISVLLD